MGTDTPTDSVEKKPVIPDGSSSRRFNRKVPYVKRERFQGAHPDLMGYVFESGTSRTNQIANFAKVDERIRALIGQQFDPYVLESIETKAVCLPGEPQMAIEADGSVSRMEEIKYSKKFDRWLTRTESSKSS